MKQSFVGLLAVILAASGCDLAKKLAGTDAATTSTDPDGLPQECVDYLALLKCVNAKSNPATAQSQTDGVRAGFKAVVVGSGAAAANKQCADLVTGSQAGFAQVGCTNGATAAASPPQSTTPTPSAAIRAPSVSSAAPTKSPAISPKSDGKNPPAKHAKVTCGPRKLRSTRGLCEVSTCKTDDDCSPQACSLVRDGVRACSGSIGEIDPDEFR
jgi:hypothetical protein